MKKSELKSVLKPLIKECIKEAIFEEGVLSSIITEVARGIGTVQTQTPAVTTPPSNPVFERMQRNAFDKQQSTKIQEHKKKLMSAIGGDTFNGANLFEGTTPAPGQASPEQQARPLSGQAPGDAGVDISNLFGAVGRNWTAHMSEIKEDGKK